MRLTIELLFIIILGVLFYQDIKERQVSLWVFVFGILLGGFLHFLEQDTIVFLVNTLVNIAFVGIILGVLYLYAKFKMKQHIFEVFGLGDLLFFILLAVSLPILSFLMIFVFSLVFSLIIFIVLKPKLTNKTVPLAGLQSIFLGLVLIINKFIDIDIYTM